MIGNDELAYRLLLAAAFGGIVGFERELKDQPAGLRTHILVALGSCLFTLVSAFGFEVFAGRPSTTAVRADVTRIASQVVVGIGFLGGGTILRAGGSVRGLTTAASLWVTAAIGLAVGAGFLVGAAIAAGITVFSLAALKPIERILVRRGGPPDDENDSGP